MTLNIDKLVVIGGCQRSGTTLIHRLLSSHPDVHGVMTDTAVFNNYKDFRTLTGIDEPKTLADMQAILSQLLTNSHVRKWQLDPKEMARFANRFAPCWDSIFLCLLEAVKEKFRKPVIALKNPGGEFAFAHLRNQFLEHRDKLKLIYCVRNPIDTYQSWKHRTTSWFECDRPEALPLYWSALWLKSTLELMDFRYRFPESVRVVRFTDLLNSPTDFAKNLCEYSGLNDCSKQMLEQLDAAPNSSFRDTNLPKVLGDVVDVRARANDLSQWEIDSIRAACGKRAASFGYDLGEPSSKCNTNRVLHDVALENIPTHELLRYGWKLIVRRAWTRFFTRPLTCEEKQVSSLAVNGRSPANRVSLRNE